MYKSDFLITTDADNEQFLDMMDINGLLFITSYYRLNKNIIADQIMVKSILNSVEIRFAIQ